MASACEQKQAMPEAKTRARHEVLRHPEVVGQGHWLSLSAGGTELFAQHVRLAVILHDTHHKIRRAIHHDT